MIRTVWFYLMLVVSSFVHAATVIVAALVGVKRRPGGRGIYDWGTTDWARGLLDAAGPPRGGGGPPGIPPGRPGVFGPHPFSHFYTRAAGAAAPHPGRVG